MNDVGEKEVKHTVVQVVENELCCGCGTCVGVCPTEAISLNISEGLFLPSVDDRLCIECQLCFRVCPGHSVDFQVLCSSIFEDQPYNPMIGSYLSCYVGHSCDDQIRYASTSGGIATQLLIFALENGIIDGAIVTRMREENPLEPESFIARTREEIIDASRSKYCPVAANVVLKDILKEEGRFAIVGLPCHIHGVLKAEGLLNALRNRIVLHIGLLCSHMVNFNGTDFLIDKLNVDRSNVKGLSYRGSGWPGGLMIKLVKGPDVGLPLFGSWNSYWPVFSSFFFTPKRCMMCPDQSAELADISLGDAWLPELSYERKGKSIIVTRTRRGEELLSLAKENKVLEIKSVKVEKVLESQAINLRIKKDDLPSRLFLYGLFGKNRPRYKPDPEYHNRPSVVAVLRACFIYLNIWASSNRIIVGILKKVPFPLFRFYYGLYKYFSLI